MIETESLLTAVQDNTVGTNYVKAKIGEIQQDSKFRLYGKKDERVYHIICKYGKSAPKE